MSDSYPRRDQARGIWKINDITKNIKSDGTYPKGSTRGLFAGGETPTDLSTIDFITIETSGNATDFGELTAASLDGAGTGSFTRAIFGGFRTPSVTDTIEYTQFDTTGNCADFGNLTQSRSYLDDGCAGNNVRALWTCGSNGAQYNVIDFVTIASIGNATDFGDLAFTTTHADGLSNNTRGVFSGLSNTSAPGADGTFGNAPQILYVTIASTGNTTLFGELTARRYGTAPASNGHGGLS